MSEEKHCSKCGKPVPGESPRGICPACLMEQAMASRTIVTGQPDAELPPPPSPEEIADKFPQYEVLECLGRGGMGVVYKARQKSLDRWVAIKVLAPERVHEERFAEHFEREAKTLAKMSHPNIVTVFDHGETGGLFYIVMEFVDGVILRDLLREGKMEPEQALVIVPPICDALQYAHDKGIVHRDIKPENILLDRDGRVKIADFGIASLVGASGESSGTPPYMAPEQSGGTVDRRADIYALGVVLYEMLTGERPEKDLVAPSKRVEVSVKIDEMVLRALEKEPERRYQTAGEFGTVVRTMAATPANSVQPDISADDTRFSRTAIVGACWASFAFIALFLATIQIGPSSSPPTGRAWWQWILMFTVLPLGITAPFGATILGWISVTRIRYSAGKLHGMWLAVFDGLLFPLLVLAGMIAWFWHWVFSGLIRDSILSGGPELNTLQRLFVSNATAFTVLATLFTSLVAAFYIIQKVWRVVSVETMAHPERSSGPEVTASFKPSISVWPIAVVAYVVTNSLWAVTGVADVTGNGGLADRLFPVLLVSWLIACALWAVLHHECWKALPEKHRATTPGKAVGFLFIPFFNLYWAFVSFPKLAEGVNAWEQERGRKPNPSIKVLGVLYAINFVLYWTIAWNPVVGLFVCVFDLVTFFLFYPWVVRSMTTEPVLSSESDVRPVSVPLANLALGLSVLGALIPVAFVWATLPAGIQPGDFEQNIIRVWIVSGVTLSLLVAAIGLGWSTRRLARGKAALIAASLSLLIAGASIIAGLQQPIQFDTPIIVKSPDGSMSGMGMTLHSMRMFDSDRVTYRLLVEGANGGETWMSEVPLEDEGGLARPLNDLSFEKRGKIDWSEDGETVSFRVGDTLIAVFDINATRWKTDGLLGDDFPAASAVQPVGGEQEIGENLPIKITGPAEGFSQDQVRGWVERRWKTEYPNETFEALEWSEPQSVAPHDWVTIRCKFSWTAPWAGKKESTIEERYYTFTKKGDFVRSDKVEGGAIAVEEPPPSDR